LFFQFYSIDSQFASTIKGHDGNWEAEYTIGEFWEKDEGANMMNPSFDSDDANMIVESFAEGPSFRFYNEAQNEENSSDAVLVTILVGQSETEFRGLKNYIDQVHNMIERKPRVTLLCEEVRRRQRCLKIPRGRRIAPSQFNWELLKEWLHDNPVQLTDDEKPFFQLRFDELLNDCSDSGSSPSGSATSVDQSPVTESIENSSEVVLMDTQATSGSGIMDHESTQESHSSGDSWKYIAETDNEKEDLELRELIMGPVSEAALISETTYHDTQPAYHVDEGKPMDTCIMESSRKFEFTTNQGNKFERLIRKMKKQLGSAIRQITCRTTHPEENAREERTRVGFMSWIAKRFSKR